MSLSGRRRDAFRATYSASFGTRIQVVSGIRETRTMHEMPQDVFLKAFENITVKGQAKFFIIDKHLH